MILFSSIKKKNYLKCIVLLVLAVFVTGMTSAAFAAELSPLDQWARSKLKFNCNSIIYANDTFLAVGEGGKMLTSQDGKSWSEKVSNTNGYLNGVTYGDDTYVVTGIERISKKKNGITITSSTGITLISTDSGMNWNRRILSPESTSNQKLPVAVAYGNNTFVAVGPNGTIFTSTNGGIDWTDQKMQVDGNPSELALGEVTYGNGIFVAVGQNGVIQTSTNGLIWTDHMVKTATNSFLNSVIYGSNTFVAVGSNGTILTSPDGEVWTRQTIDKAESGDRFTGIAYGSNHFVITNDSKSSVLTSTDGINWVSRDTGNTIAETYNEITYGNHGFYIAGNKVILSSSFTPVVSEITTKYGLKEGGTTVNINGSSLSVVKDVYFGDTKALKITLGSNTQMSAVAPPSVTSGSVQVKVVGPEGIGKSCGEDIFTYADIVVSPSSSAVQSGQTATLTAAVDGIDPYCYLWKKDGACLFPDDHITDVASNSLVIKNALPSDAGEYTCTACMDDGKGRVYYLKSKEVTLKVDSINTTGNVFFDLESPSDVDTSIFWDNTAKVNSIAYQTKLLESPKDYKMAGKTLIITEGFLSGLNLLENDTAEFKISLDTGNTATLTVKAVRSHTLTVNAGPGGSIKEGSGKYLPGTSVIISAKPASGYAFTQWISTGGGIIANNTSAVTTYTMPANAATLTAIFTYADSGHKGGNGNGGKRDGNADKTQQITAVISGGPADKAGVTVPVNTNKDTRSASVDLGTQSENVFAGGGAKTITVPDIPGVDKFTLGIPVDSLSTANGKGKATFSTGIGSMILPENMLALMKGTEGRKAEISISLSDKSGLPDAAKAAIGDRPLIQLTLVVDGKQTDWNNPDAPVTISIPYKPTAEELVNPECIVVWYIDGSGKAVSIPNGHYDPATGMVTFRTTHFSYYAIGNNKVIFRDVPANAWYEKAVGFIAARDITTGTGGGIYNPKAKLTRAEFLVMMMRAYGIDPDESQKDNFADAGSRYYSGYLAAAKSLGISGGVGNNMFAPDKEITRQEMFTLLYSALKVVGELPEGNSGKQFSAFSDTGQIASWAKDAMTLFVKTGTISGNDGKLSPTGTTTRAEMAQVLYQLLSN